MKPENCKECKKMGKKSRKNGLPLQDLGKKAGNYNVWKLFTAPTRKARTLKAHQAEPNRNKTGGAARRQHLLLY